MPGVAGRGGRNRRWKEGAGDLRQFGPLFSAHGMGKPDYPGTLSYSVLEGEASRYNVKK